MEHWRFGLAVPGGWAAAAAIGALFVILLVLSARPSGLPPGRRVALWLLRLASLTTAWLLIVQATWTGERVSRAPGRLVILADASRSMGVDSPEAGAPRAEVAQRLVERWAGEQGSSTHEAYTFGANLESASLGSLAEAYPAGEDATRLGASLAALVAPQTHATESRTNAQSPGDLTAVVVVSDGAATDLEAEQTARWGLRIHAVAIGAADTLEDDAIVRVEADSVGFIRQPARVRVELRSRERSVPVTVLQGNSVVRQATADIGPDGKGHIDLEFTPTKLGRAVYRVVIPTVPGDAVASNNERSFLIRVGRNRLRVLLVAGRPNWEERFLREFLKRDASVDLISFFILRTSSDLSMAAPDELALIPFPTDELFREHLDSFDVVFFENFNYGPYQMAPYLDRIRDYVLQGGSFAMLGGELSFASGGYADTPLADILPVELPNDDPSSERLLIQGAFVPNVDRDRAGHPLVALAPDTAESLRAWSRLSPLIGANLVEGVRENAYALLSHPKAKTRAGDPMPVLVLGTRGQGRSLAFAADTSWRWGMTTAGRTGDLSAYDRFWDRIIRWLARDPALEPARLSTDRERYGPGADMRVEAIARTQSYEPMARESAELIVTALDGDKQIAKPVAVELDEHGRLATDFAAPLQPGPYRVALHSPGQSTALCDEVFVVEAGGDELADPHAHPERLQALAAATGGTFIRDPQHAPALSEFDASSRRVVGIVKTAPLNTFWFFALFAALLAFEWGLRRRWSLP